eukprot:11164276-Prorocentrum_lima.AAC.1
MHADAAGATKVAHGGEHADAVGGTEEALKCLSTLTIEGGAGTGGNEDVLNDEEAVEAGVLNRT